MVALAIVSMGALAVTLDAQQGQERGGAAAGGQGAGRGNVRPECVNPKIPAAECNIGATPINWADPPLGDGPFLIESARPEHRNLRVVVMARLRQPWSIAFLPDNAILVTERGGQLRIIRNGVLDPDPGCRHAGGPCLRPAGADGRRAPPALRGEPLHLSRVPQASEERRPEPRRAKRRSHAECGTGRRSRTSAISSRRALPTPSRRELDSGATACCT